MVKINCMLKKIYHNLNIDITLKIPHDLSIKIFYYIKFIKYSSMCIITYIIFIEIFFING